ncbi:type III PLP-dependent enzyme [Tropicibacter naphthalenivorans]|uniref:ornithine decarboxylase n=1 Tax=Tropicibacter naphthalenivorans TaxID=441103 RepID=A0A0P1G3Y3_9RHOB|nr:type III PLP-dependent enzyme [Tropicibacter naphthalenivorans]CUH76450.1 Lysine/ornithine decarboxylase [Tropicibacter naphthalenivorans]SMC66056.1 ornithine decarboxylase [Tropicibacter naphthalenivorans]
MGLQQAFQTDPGIWLAKMQPDDPVFFFDPARLRQTADTFHKGFPGLTTYAVKANPDRGVIETLVSAGMTAFDVASIEEMALVRDIAPDAVLHYHNPVRSRAEIAQARDYGCASWSVDRMSELDKLGDLHGLDIAVRLKLPVKGAVYDFGSKFGAGLDETAALLRAVIARGGLPSVTFHPGTQCDDPLAWVSYITAIGDLTRDHHIALHRLNVGGGFPAHRGGEAPDLERIFTAIRAAATVAFDAPPPLVCEPGRAMVAESYQLALRAKAVTGGAVFLNDGIYGGLSEWRDLGPGGRIRVLTPQGQPRLGPAREFTVFGPTCDSLDRLSERVALPGDLRDDDYLLFEACGAYSTALSTRFNGYGARRVVTLAR